MPEGKLISQVCNELDLHYEGDDVLIDGLKLIGRNTSKRSTLSYVTSKKYVKKVEREELIRALVVSPDILVDYRKIFFVRGGSLIISREPEKTFYQIHEHLIKQGDFYKPVVDKTAISPTASIHSSAIVEENVIIEDNVFVGAFSLIKSGSIIRHGSVIGNYTTIGAEGYQVIKIDEVPYKVKHCGGCLIEDNVEIGDHCTVCNTIFDGYTHIGSHTKIDNYCQIAHYSNIGRNVVITPNVTIVGSVTVEDDCYIGAGATIMNNSIIQRGSTVGIGAVVVGNVKRGETVFGNPAKKIY